MSNLARVVFSPLLLVLLAGSLQDAWALQVHNSPEGLVVHQLAHVFFVATMVLLIYWLQKNRFVEETGWRLIQIACVLLVLWNVVAFAGHMVARNLDSILIVGETGSIGQRILLQESWWAPYYYVLHLDHLISVPAILCLFLGIRSLSRQIIPKEDTRS